MNPATSVVTRIPRVVRSRPRARPSGALWAWLIGVSLGLKPQVPGVNAHLSPQSQLKSASRLVAGPVAPTGRFANRPYIVGCGESSVKRLITHPAPKQERGV